jgi:hypothetical protein
MLYLIEGYANKRTNLLASAVLVIAIRTALVQHAVTPAFEGSKFKVQITIQTTSTSTAMSAVASETYQKLLLPKGHGIPLYFPGLYDNLPAACRDRGVTIGDVGIITDEGGFDFLFNVCQPCDDPVNIDRIAPSFPTVVLNESIDLGSRECGFPTDSSIVSSNIKKTGLSLGASVTNS